MELRELESFVAVVDHGGFTRAAEALGITQPGVSAQVAKLERELGEQLLVRAGRRGVSLTAAGEAVLGTARTVLEASDAVRTAVTDLSGLLVGRVRLGHVSAGASASLVEPLTAFHRRHPAVEVSLVEDRSERLLAALLDGDLDLAWVGVAGPLPRGIDVRVVVDERLVLGVAEKDPLAERAQVSFDQAAAMSLVAMPLGTGSRSAFESGCRERGLEPRIAFECSSPELIGALVERGVGVAVLPEPLAPILGLVPVPLVRPSVRSRIVLAWNADAGLSPAARAFLAAIGAG